jgi:hypothetical protein
MTAFTRTKVGPPSSGRYLVGDAITDSAGTKWRCAVGGMAGPYTSNATAKFVADGSSPKHQAAPAAKTVSATLTAAEVVGGLITVNQGASGASALQMPINTALDAALPSMQVDDSFDFSLVNISTVAAEDASITVNTGVTVVGNMTVASNAAVGDQATGIFRVRKTAASTYVVYRVAS